MFRYESLYSSSYLLNEYLLYDKLWGPSQRVVTLFYDQDNCPIDANDSAFSTLGVHENVETNNSDLSKANIETAKRLRKDERGIRGQILLGDKPTREAPT